ncbi:tRNA adenosine(34) deaminase TadA [Endozoicomonas sp. SM1973]|uniref:tRNA-specific adenosine deaminase n=1 Tax=Spartinivicinus marinus TaxID=2994442 RepID=A0A853HXY1_9GAMM|nr:tRNA adenosine(34) deaminase TadA [Spartinivicinus marinus]MCX4025542.1 tRNA adenosine(34) deaminase TadA [Spartinivicinus marinus]NYZ65229.1 tRNA adenosine(34) deaminase TadA [Spartinivicinus marinus]
MTVVSSSQVDINWMHQAIELAQRGAKAGEVPVGAIVVYQGDVIGRGFNQPISSHNPVAHAEMMALIEAAQHLNNYRLVDCDLYVTLEPCTMCAGAIIHSRINRLVYGAYEPKAGAAGSVTDVFSQPQMNHIVEVTGGVLAEECGQLLSDFFKARRQAKKLLRQQQKEQ